MLGNAILSNWSSMEDAMKNATIALLAAILLVPGLVLAQENTAESKPVASPRMSAKTLMVSGKVSDDGKMLVTDLDSEWAVSNAEILKGLEGRLVRVKCYVDSARNQLQILSVKRENSDYAARHADSAFRR